MEQATPEGFHESNRGVFSLGQRLGLFTHLHCLSVRGINRQQLMQVCLKCRFFILAA
jgi:hypothetical protein